jgi:hypothetical protein
VDYEASFYDSLNFGRGPVEPWRLAFRNPRQPLRGNRQARMIEELPAGRH